MPTYIPVKPLTTLILNPGARDFSKWYRKNPGGTRFYDANSTDPAKQAYDAAVGSFLKQCDNADTTRSLLSHATLPDVVKTIEALRSAYEKKTQKSKKLKKYLHKLTSRIMYYGSVLDVLAQHHPEYVSLVWGTMKFLLQGVLNHEELVVQLAKGITKIADSLPRTELQSILYPTAHMQQSIQVLYSHIIRFLMRAMKWYQQPTWKRTVSSITEPFVLHFKDILEDISEASRKIDQLALAASQAELRDMHIMMASIRGVLVDEISPGIRDIQLSLVLDFVSKTKFIEPEASLRYCKFLSNRRNGMKRYIVNAQLLSTLGSWAATDCSSTIVIKGASLRLPAQCQDFGADLIECAKCSNIPLIWALEAAPRDDRDRISSAVDILKYLVFQILRINSNTLPRELNATTFRSAGTENEWFILLTALLSTLPRVIIVVDSALIGERLEGDITWIDAFSRVFNDLKGRDSPTIVKMVLLNSEISDTKSDYTTLRLQAAKGKVDGRGNAAINRKKAQRGFRATLRGTR